MDGARGGYIREVDDFIGHDDSLDGRCRAEVFIPRLNLHFMYGRQSRTYVA